MARPKILVFQHVPYEPLGTLNLLLKEAGFRIRPATTKFAVQIKSLRSHATQWVAPASRPLVHEARECGRPSSERCETRETLF